MRITACLMVPFFIHIIRDKNSLNIRRTSGVVICCLLLFALLFACNKKAPEPGDYSGDFKPVFEQTSHYFDYNMPATGSFTTSIQPLVISINPPSTISSVVFWVPLRSTSTKQNATANRPPLYGARTAC